MTLSGVSFGVVGIFVLLLMLIPIVLVHELGHFVMARLAKIRVLEFGIGLPAARQRPGPRPRDRVHAQLPADRRLRASSRARRPTRTIRARSRNAKLWKQLIVLVAGVTMNLLTAFVLFFIVAWAFNPQIAAHRDSLRGVEHAGARGRPAGWRHAYLDQWASLRRALGPRVLQG